MSTVAVQKVKAPETAPSLFQSMDKLFEDVRKRAFDLFQRRGALDGRDLEDWFRAERDLVQTPESEMVETDKEMQMKIAVPAMEAKDIQISALPDAIIVQVESVEHFHAIRDATSDADRLNRLKFLSLDLTLGL